MMKPPLELSEFKRRSHRKQTSLPQLQGVCQHGYQIETKEVFTKKAGRKSVFPRQAVPSFGQPARDKTKNHKITFTNQFVIFNSRLKTKMSQLRESTVSMASQSGRDGAAARSALAGASVLTPLAAAR
jgi:hypothetical protein